MRLKHYNSSGVTRGWRTTPGDTIVGVTTD